MNIEKLINKGKSANRGMIKHCAKENFQFFCELYFRHSMHSQWTNNQLRAIEKVQRFAGKAKIIYLNMYRAEGQTTILIAASLWVILTGKSKALGIISDNALRTTDFIKHIRKEIKLNKILNEDFRKEISPLIKLQYSHSRILFPKDQGEETFVHAFIESAYGARSTMGYDCLIFDTK